eukprot:gene9760-biopygen381
MFQICDLDDLTVEPYAIECTNPELTAGGTHCFARCLWIECRSLLRYCQSPVIAAATGAMLCRCTLPKL